MGKMSAPSPVIPPAQVSSYAAGKVLVQCVGCKSVVNMLHGLTDFSCPKCKLSQTIPPSLARPPSLRPKGVNEPQNMTSPAAECDGYRTKLRNDKKRLNSSEACDENRKNRIYIRIARDKGDSVCPARDKGGDSVCPARDKGGDSGQPEGDLRKKEALKRISDNYVKSLKTETKKLCRKARDDIKGIWKSEEELLSLKLKKRKLKLDSWSKELDKRQALIEQERQKLELEKTEKDSRNNEMAEKLREAEENHGVVVKRLEKDLSGMAEKLREVEENYGGLVKRLEEKEVALSILGDIHQLSVLKEQKSNEELQEVHLELVKKDLRNNQMTEKLREAEENYRGLVERLKEKEVALSNLEDVHQHSVLKKQKINEELQEVHLGLVKLMSDIPRHRCVDFGVQRMGEVYEKAFKDACKKRFPPGEAEIKAVELHAFLEKKLRENPRWQPFKIIEDDKGNPQGILKMHDEQFQGLEGELGEQICNVMFTALIDLHKYSGSYEVLNLRENRKATLAEVISYISTHLKTLNEESNQRKRLRRSPVAIKLELPHC